MNLFDFKLKAFKFFFTYTVLNFLKFKILDKNSMNVAKLIFFI